MHKIIINIGSKAYDVPKEQKDEFLDRRGKEYFNNLIRQQVCLGRVKEDRKD